MAAALRQALPGFQQVDWLERTSSTNADLLENARTGHPRLARPWLLGTHLQESGRGRAGRTWQNRAGANLMFSCAFDVFLPPRQLPTLSPLSGLAACEALRRLLQPAHRHDLTMKWPNDLQWRFAKLAGILVEATRAGTAPLSNDHHVVIMGIGINLEDARALSAALDRKVSDWSEIARIDTDAAAVDAARIVATIAQAWQASLNHTLSHGFADLPQRYAGVDALAGQHVDVIDGQTVLRTGIANGINADGQLLVRAGSTDFPITVGEISVRAR